MTQSSGSGERSNIVLIGMPGAGKSTLGIVLAKILNYNFIDADLVIQNQCDKTLQKLIDACGPEGFIQVENQVLSDLTAERSIIATGGSAVYSDEAMRHLAEIGRVVYLQISYDELKKRLHDLQERGVVLKGGIGMSLRELYDERKPLYEQYAEITVNVDDLSITAAARKVADALSCGRSACLRCSCASTCAERCTRCASGRPAGVPETARSLPPCLRCLPWRCLRTGRSCWQGPTSDP